MPIIPSIQTTRISQEAFKELSHEVMRHAFAIHNEFGRLFDEAIYKRELADRMDNVVLEAPVDLVHGNFHKRLFADVIVSGSGLFEFKAATAFHPKHRSQAIQYLLLFDLSHGKIVNTRTERIQHEFVNCLQSTPDLQKFDIDSSQLKLSVAGAVAFRDKLVSLLRDWGTGLTLPLYEEAMLNSLSEGEPILHQISVNGTRGSIGQQRMRLAAPDVAFKLTSIHGELKDFRAHCKRLLDHTALKAIHWANIKSGKVTFSTIE